MIRRSLAGRAAAAALATAALGAAGTATAGGPRPTVEHGVRVAAPSASLSANWSGYVTAATATMFTDVKGTWVQPAAACPGRKPTYSSFWVGLGGSSSESTGLEQIGTSADCKGPGRPAYYAWYELIPTPPVTIALAVSPGDTVTGEVSYLDSAVTLSLVNITTGDTFSTVVTRAAPDLSSAEWIAEAPSQCDSRGNSCAPLPLSRFSPVAFSAASATTSNGHTGTISDQTWKAEAIQLGKSLRSLQAVASVLSGDGSGFSVAWHSSGSRELVGKPLVGSLRSFRRHRGG